MRNPGFESYATCPVGFSQFNGYINNWISPSAGSPDYYNACANPNPVSVPGNTTGYQPAHSGNAYVGMYTTSNTYREYVQVQLTSPLVAGMQYQFSMYVSLANKSNTAVDDLGAYISVNAPSSSGTAFLNGNPIPQITNPSGNVITDTLNWVLISGSYTATGGELYITLGHFKPDSLTTYLQLPYGNLGAYYFIDDVSLTGACCTDSVAFSNLTHPTCGGVNGSVTASLISGCSGTAGNYHWSNNTSNANLANVTAGNYSVTITDNSNCTASSSISLNNNGTPPVFSIAPTPATCGNNNGTLDANVTSGSQPYNFAWSNGNNNSSNHNLSPGGYEVTVTGNDGCTASASASISNVGNPPGVSIFSQNSTCHYNNGLASVTPTSGVGPFHYHWSNGVDTSFISNIASGNYSVTVYDSAGCQTNLNINISNAGTAPTLSSSSSSTTCNLQNGMADINVTAGPGPFTYQWSNGGTSDSIAYVQPGNYFVTVTGANNCSASASVAIGSSVGITASTSSTSTNCGASNGSATANGNGGAGNFSYVWSNGSHFPVISNLTSGTYLVTVTDGSGCTASASALVTQSNGIGPVSISETVNTICASDSSQICAPPGFATYTWNNGQTTQCFYSNLAGNYYVTVTDANSCSAESNHLALSIYPQPPVSISVNGDTLSSFNAASYQWYFNGSQIPGATSDFYVATQTGHYALQITDSNGCTALSLALLINVTGINSILNKGVTVYPNPSVNGAWNISAGEEWIGSQVEIFDAAGNLIYTSKIVSELMQVSPQIPGGIYLLQLRSNEITRSFKLVNL